MRVFIKDLHQQLVQRHAESDAAIETPILYRGQLMPTADFEKINTNLNGLLLMNNFLSTTAEPEVATMSAGGNLDDPSISHVLLRIDVESGTRSTTPFANIEEW